MSIVFILMKIKIISWNVKPAEKVRLKEWRADMICLKEMKLIAVSRRW